jgi:putative membrane protein
MPVEPEVGVPQEHRGVEYLANERTFLAWIRTSIAVVSLGFLIARFSLWMREMSGKTEHVRLFGVSAPAGEALMVFGGVLAILAGWRYHVVNRAIEENRVKPDRALIILIAVSVTVFALIMAVVIYAASKGDSSILPR